MRGKSAKKRKLTKDAKYKSELVNRFITKIMWSGKRTLAEKLFYSSLESAAKELKVEPMNVLEQVMENVRPSLEVKSRRVGGANYQVPVPVSPDRQQALVIRWIVDSARGKSGESLESKLKKELVAAFGGAGDAVRKKEETERMAEANKAFAHFRW